MTNDSDTAGTEVRVMATARQMRDRLDALLTGLDARRADDLPHVCDQAAEALRIACEVHDQHAEARARGVLGACALAAHNPGPASAELGTALRLFDATADPDRAAATLIMLGRARASLTDIPGALAAYSDAHERYTALGDRPGTALALTALGNLYTDGADYPNALEHHTAALQICRALGDERRIAVSLADLAAVYSALGDHAHALGLLAEAVAAYDRCGEVALLARAHGSIAGLQLAHGDPSDALDAALRSLVVLESLGDTAGVVEALVMLGKIHERLGHVDEAYDHLAKATATAAALKNDALLARTLPALAGIERRRGRHWEAIAHLERALAYAVPQGDRVLACNVHELLALTCEELGVLDRALVHMRQRMNLREELLGEEKRRLVAEVEVRHALAQAEREREQFRARAEELQSEVELKRRELTALAFGMASRNRVLDAIAERIAAGTAAAHNPGALLGDVAGAIESMRNGEEEWRAFEERFNELDRDFLRTLAARHPELTPTEMKICALLRTNIASKEVASLLYLAERTVENHRYRLRRKFGLAADVGLAAYLASL